MSLMMSQILKFVDLPKNQKSKYFENKTFFSSNVRIHLLDSQGYYKAKKDF